MIDNVLCSLDGELATCFESGETFELEDGMLVVEATQQDVLREQMIIAEGSKKYYPPKGAIEVCRSILKMKEKYGDEVKGGTAVGWTRARQIASGKGVSRSIVLRMAAFFYRHEKNKDVDPKYEATPWKDRGWVAWRIWGGDPAKTWSQRMAKKIRGE